MLAGSEVGRQLTDNFRNTGFFNNTVTSVFSPVYQPDHQYACDLSPSCNRRKQSSENQPGCDLRSGPDRALSFVQVTAGLRFDYFDLQYHNNRNNDTLRRIDHLLSPRAGIVVKPIAAISLYGSYGVTYLPSSGDQFSSLTTITQQMKPEKFSNYELGAKWDIQRSLSLTTAVFRLDRTNTRATDPNDPTRIVQTGSQRTNGSNSERMAASPQPGGSPEATAIRMRSSLAPQRRRVSVRKSVKYLITPSRSGITTRSCENWDSVWVPESD